MLGQDCTWTSTVSALLSALLLVACLWRQGAGERFLVVQPQLSMRLHPSYVSSPVWVRALCLGSMRLLRFSCLFTNQKGKLYISSSSKSDCRAEIKIRRGKSSEKCLLFQFSPSCWLLTGKQLLLCFPFLLGGSCPARVMGLEHREPNGTEHVPRPHRLPWASTHRDVHSQVWPGAASRLFFFSAQSWNLSQ